MRAASARNYGTGGRKGNAGRWRRKRGGSVGLQHLAQGCMHVLVTGDDGVLVEHLFGTSEISGETARLAQDHEPGGDVPRRKAALPETIEAPSGDPGKIQRGGPRAADAGDLVLHRPELGAEARDIAAAAVGNA